MDFTDWESPEGKGTTSKPIDDNAKFLAEVTAEAKRAREKFPHARDMVAVLTEEVGEVAEAFLQGQYERSYDGIIARRRRLREELVQVAAMAMRFAVEGTEGAPWTMESPCEAVFTRAAVCRRPAGHEGDCHA